MLNLFHRLHAHTHTHLDFPRIIVDQEGREEERVKSRDTRDDTMTKARDQTRMIITRVVNTSLEVILF